MTYEPPYRVKRSDDWTVAVEKGYLRRYHLRSNLREDEGPALCGCTVDWNIAFPLTLWNTEAPVEEFWCTECEFMAGGVKEFKRQEAVRRSESRANRRRRIATIQWYGDLDDLANSDTFDDDP